jgi:ATP-dependent RNA helicase SUPV3L1/SUV3
MPLLKPAPVRLRAILWAVCAGQPVPVPPRQVAGARDPALSEAAYAAMGYRVLGPRYLRVDKLERLAAAARRCAAQGAFGPSPELAGLAGCSAKDLPAVMAALGYRVAREKIGEDEAIRFHRRANRAGSARRKRDAERARDACRGRGAAEDSPFAKLRDLSAAR